MLGQIRKIITFIYQNFAFPYKIGCGLAGGNWDHYLPMIEDFTVKYQKHVTLVKKY